MPKAVARETWHTVLYGLKNNGVDLAIKRMASLIPKDDPIAAEAAAALSFLANLEAAASTTDVESMPAPVTETKKDPDTGLSERERQLNQRETQMRRSEWAGTSRRNADAVFEKTWTDLTKGKRFTPKDRENITALVERRMGIVMRPHRPEIDRLFQVNDRDGYLRFMQSTHLKELPRVLKAEIAGYGGAGKPVAAAAVPGQPGAQRVAPQQGFRAIAQQPPSNHIDHRPNATTKAMIIAHQAVIKPEYRQHYGGAEKVQWPKAKV